MDDRVIKQKPLSLLGFIISVILPLVGALALFYILMRPTMHDLRVMIGLMSITAFLSTVVAFAAYRLGWLNFAPNIRWSLMGAYALSGFLIILNIWIIARLMFASEYDLMLATILMIFSSGIAMSVAFFLSKALTDRIALLAEAAHHIAAGELGTRVEISGKDEMTQLARAFNDMSQRLQETEQKQRELDIMRRDLIAWIGHDLRTPLTSIRAILEALADGVVDEPEMEQRYLETAQRDIRSLSHLIDDLFEMSQLDAEGLKLDHTRNSISDLISDTIESFSEVAQQEQVDLHGCAESGLELICMDVQRIGRVLNNLVANAIRHTQAGGEVNVCANSHPDGIEVEVSDTGEGIKKEDLPHVFDRFYRGEKSRSRRTGGSGLGLAIAKGIVEAHGGQIGVKSIIGEGTTFHFTLPRH